jgi:O-antigen/teichoic acid export membrane protein
LVSRLLDDPQAGSVLIALSLNAVLATVTHFYGAVLQRELRFREVFLCDAASVITVSVVSIGLAVAGAGVWSLVGGFIAGATAKSTLLLILTPYRVRLAFDRRQARELVAAGRGFFLQGGLAFVEQNADYAAVGSVAGAGPLGLYSMSYRVSEVPYDGLVQPIAQTTFPGFARMKTRAEPVREPFLQVLRLTALVGLPLGVIASGAAEPIVEAILGEKWLGAIGLLHILGVWGSVRVVQGTIAWFLNGMDHASAVGVRYAAMLAVSLPLVVVAAHAAGPHGVAWVMVANVVVMTVIVAGVTRDREQVPLRMQWQAVRVSVAGSIVAWVATTAATRVGDGLPPMLALLFSLTAGVVAYVAVVFALDRALPQDAWRQIRRIVARAPEPAHP